MNEEKRKQIENDAAMYKWINHDKYTPGERAALLRGYQVGATTEANKALPLLEKYGRHLPTCNLNQNWLEADEAMALTPDKDRDEGYYEALMEIEEKKKKCTCGFQQSITNYKNQ